MSSETLPISPARFAEAIRDLPAGSLHLKALELRNSLAHLAYSNAQLRPFADGHQAAHDGGAPGVPDPDCADAIRENEAVMARMRARIALVRAEVEARGLSWAEFEAKDELDDDGEPGVAAAPAAANGSVPSTNGVNGHAAAAADNAARDTTGAASSTGRNPWTDGTFQTGVIRNGEVVMDAVPVHVQRSGEEATTSAAEGAAGPGQGRAWLSDEELQRVLELRLAEDGHEEEDGGMHL